VRHKKTGHVQTEWINWQEQQSRDFHTSVAPWFLIQMAPNLQWRCPPLMGDHIQNLKKIPSAIPEIQTIKLSKNFFVFSSYSTSSFHTLCINCYNSRMCASIWLNFGTRIGGLKTNTSIKLGINLINIWGVTSDFTHKTKFNFCQAYRVTCLEEQAENRYVVRLNIRGVLFGS